MPLCLPKGREPAAIPTNMKKLLTKLLLKILSVYKDIRYFFGPKITVGRLGEYETFEEADSQVREKWTLMEINKR